MENRIDRDAKPFALCDVEYIRIFGIFPGNLMPSIKRSLGNINQ